MIRVKKMKPQEVTNGFLDVSSPKNIMGYVALEMSKYERLTAQVAGKIASKLYKHLPENDFEFLHLCKVLMETHKRTEFSIATIWLKRRTSVITMGNMGFFEKIVLKHLHNWAEVDQFCYRVMNPMIELEAVNFRYLDKWSKSSNKDTRRVSLVSMIRSSGKLTLEYDYEKMILLVERLKHDDDFHVRKAVGWVLKCAFVTYPNKVEEYLRNNVNNLDRMIFRYALENIGKKKKDELMNIKRVT